MRPLFCSNFKLLLTLPNAKMKWIVEELWEKASRIRVSTRKMEIAKIQFLSTYSNLLYQKYPIYVATIIQFKNA